MINDVSGLADAQMIEVVHETGAGLVIGHLRGTPDGMQKDIHFADLLEEVGDELGDAVQRALSGGVKAERLMVDPGVGFGKTAQQSAALVLSGERLRARTGCPVLIGASRKRFLENLGCGPVEGRTLGSIASALCAAQFGASMLRVHDVEETMQALGVQQGLEKAYEAQLRKS